MKKIISMILVVSFIFTNIVFGLEKINSLDTAKEDFVVGCIADAKYMKDIVTFKLNSFTKEDTVFIEIYGSDKKPIVNEQFNSDTIEIKNMKRDINYQFNLKINDNEYVGDIIIWEDFDNHKLEVNISNLISSNTYSSMSKSTVNETESNNTMSLADTINDDDDVYGYVSSTTDIDWFKVKFNETGRANFWVDVPSNQDYDLYLYDNSGNLINQSIKGTGSDELLSKILVQKDIYYYIKILGYGSSYSTTQSYHLRAKNYEIVADTWYSQVLATVGETYSTTNLTKFFFPNYGGDSTARNTPLYALATYTNPYLNPNNVIWYDKGLINKWGCVNNSIAMVMNNLRNLGTETSSSCYDVRTGITGKLDPDPYSVVMANNDYPTISSVVKTLYGTSTTETAFEASGVTSDALYFTSISSVAQEFGYPTRRTYLSGTAEERAEILTEALKEHPEGILVRVNGNYGHTLVFASSAYVPNKSYTSEVNNLNIVALTPEIERDDIMKEKNDLEQVSIKSATSTGYEQYFKVYDPGTSLTSKGDNVTFNNSWSFINNNSNINSIPYFDVVDFD